jgi:hypothetical protein
MAVVAFGVGIWNTTDRISKSGGRPPVKADERVEYLSQQMAVYRGIRYVNEHAAPGDTTYVVDGRFFRYYFETRVLDSPRGGTDELPRWTREGEADWVASLKARNVTWVVIDYLRDPKVTETVREPPFWQEYPLVYADERVWVYRQRPRSGAPTAPVLVTDGACDAAPTAAGPVTVEGYLETVNCGQIGGWAWDPNRPNCPLIIEISDGESVLSTLIAKNFRSDLLAARKGAGYHAFSMPTPQSLKDGLPHRIGARGARSPLALLNSPSGLTCGRR